MCAYIAGTDRTEKLQLLQGQGAALESLAQCMQLSWMGILVGPSGSGRATTLAQLQSAEWVHAYMACGNSNVIISKSTGFSSND